MIDWIRVNELRSEVGVEDFNEVVLLFLEEVDEVIEELKAAPDPAQYEEQLHFLKGSALNLGFAHFSALCQIGETQAAQGQLEAVQLPEILAAFDLSRMQFVEKVNEPATA
ncbi:MAG: Hpt domain-containing protein [Paracoccaceae bacterium]